MTKKTDNHPFELEAKKSLGQNFLKNTHIIRQIVQAGEIEAGDTILEIGPGTGALTEEILKTITTTNAIGVSSKIMSTKDATHSQQARLIAIEKDHRAITILQEKFADFIKKGVLVLIEGDFLTLDLKEIFDTLPTGNISDLLRLKVIANIPYYITGLIIRKLLESEQQPSTAILLVQKEVAERIKTRNNILSHSIHVYGTYEMVCKVGKHNFVPAPKVDSAVIKISNISKNLLSAHNLSDQFFFKVLKAGFAHKRKKLINNLVDADIASKQNLENLEIFKNQNIRAENLTTKDWVILASAIQVV